MSTRIAGDSEKDAPRIDTSGRIETPEETEARKKAETDRNEQHYRQRLLNAETRQANAQQVQARASKATVFLTTGLVTISLVGGFVSYWQFQAAKASANAALAASMAAMQQVRAAQEANRLSEINGTSSRRQAKTALDASIEASRSDLRAWLTSSDIHLVKEPVVGEKLEILFDVANSGRTPATNVSLRYHAPINFAAPPANYNWSAIVPIPTSMVFQGGRLHDERITIDGGLMTQTVVDTYRAMRTSLFVQTRIEYDDTFGCHHWTQTCDTHSFGETGFSQCKNGGIGIDTNTCKQSH